LTAVEVLDGFSSEWGASSGDIIANASALLVSQELLWKEQRITPKFSFHTTQYAVQTQCFRELTCGTNSKITMDKPIGFQSIYTPSIKAQKSLNGLI
jgi:hypothetical protein